MTSKILNWIEAAKAIEKGETLEIKVSEEWEELNYPCVELNGQYRIKSRKFNQGFYFYLNDYESLSNKILYLDHHGQWLMAGSNQNIYPDLSKIGEKIIIKKE